MKTEVDSPSASGLTPPASVSALKSFVRYWLPVVLWMLLIFSFSTEAGSPRHTSRILVPLLRWFNPTVSAGTIELVQFVVRKMAHVTEYAVLAWLIWRARRRPMRGDLRPWGWSEAAFALGLTVLFAASDEWHQSFIPSREGRARDVLIDTAGAVAALSAIGCLGPGRRRG